MHRPTRDSGQFFQPVYLIAIHPGSEIDIEKN